MALREVIFVRKCPRFAVVGQPGFPHIFPSMERMNWNSKMAHSSGIAIKARRALSRNLLTHVEQDESEQ